MQPSEPPAGASYLQASAAPVIETLRGHAFLVGLNEAQLANLASIAQPVTFYEHEPILTAKQPAQDFYLLLSGSVSVELDKKYFVVRIQALGPGDAFGYSALLEAHESMFDVRARECCSAMRLDGGRLRQALRD